MYKISVINGPSLSGSMNYVYKISPSCIPLMIMKLVEIWGCFYNFVITIRKFKLTVYLSKIINSNFILELHVSLLFAFSVIMDSWFTPDFLVEDPLLEKHSYPSIILCFIALKGEDGLCLISICKTHKLFLLSFRNLPYL